MPKVPTTSTAPPTFEQVQADVKKFGPLTQRYAETVAQKMGMRHATGELLRYNTRRSRGLDHIHEQMFHGRASEDDLVQAVLQFTTGQASLVEAAGHTNK